MLGVGVAAFAPISGTAAATAPAPSTSGVLALVKPAIDSDFNGDGVADLAIAAPWDDYDGHSHTPGGVHIFYGVPAVGSAPADAFLTPTSDEMHSARSELVGVSIASGDFNRDGYADLAMGAPAYDTPSQPNCGAVLVVYGTGHGLDPAGSHPFEVWTQDSAGVLGALEMDDAMGTSMGAGDFDGDGYSDLAIGAEGETMGAGEKHQGAVNVLYGGAGGLSGKDDETWSQDSAGIKGTAEKNDRAAHSLAVGDFDGDGLDDLALGVSPESLGSAHEAGAVNVIYGTRSGLSGAGDQFVSQHTPGVEGAPEDRDSFGETLAAGDINGDGRDELVIGTPNETVSGDGRSGLVTVIPGAMSGLDAAASLTMGVASLDIDSRAGHFGGGLALGDVDADGFDELAIGSPLAGTGGRVDLFGGSGTGLALTSHTELLGFDWDTPEGPSGAHFGAALWFGAADTTVGDDLLVGDPFATFVIDGVEVSAGAARFFPSDGTAVSGARSRVLHEGLAGVPSARERYDRFGNGFPGSSYPW